MMKWRSRALFGGAVAGALVIAIVWLTSSQSQADPPTLPKEDDLKPHWHVGDSWIVETSTKPVQSRGAPPREPIVSQWKFKVTAEEKLGEDKCFRLDITSEPLSKTQ